MEKSAQESRPAQPEGARGNLSPRPGGAASPRRANKPLAAGARASPRPGLAPRRPRALTFQSSSAPASAFASAPGSRSRPATLLFPGTRGSPASGRGHGRGLAAGGGIFRERVPGAERSPSVRQGAVRGPVSS